MHIYLCFIYNNLLAYARMGDQPSWSVDRYYVLFHLPQLKFLDSSVIHTSELAEAKRRGQYMQVIRPVVATEEVRCVTG